MPLIRSGYSKAQTIMMVARPFLPSQIAPTGVSYVAKGIMKKMQDTILAVDKRARPAIERTALTTTSERVPPIGATASSTAPTASISTGQKGTATKTKRALSARLSTMWSKANGTDADSVDALPARRQSTFRPTNASFSPSKRTATMRLQTKAMKKPNHVASPLLSLCMLTSRPCK